MDADIDLFVRKFKELWKSGRSAHLNLDTHGGEAWIWFRVRIGHAVQQPHHQHKERTRNSPSRQLLMVQRKLQGKEEAEKASTNDAIDENAGN